MARRVFPNPGRGGGIDVDTVMFYVALAGGGYVTYTLALQGSLGKEMTKVAAQLYAAFNGGKLPPARPTAPIGGKPPGVPSGPPVVNRPVVVPPSGSSGGVTPGYVEGGYVFLGGDAGDNGNWAALYAVPNGQRGYVEDGWVLIGDASVASGWAMLHTSYD